MHSNYTQLPNKILVDLINNDNATAFQVADLEFGLPVTIPTTNGGETFNNRFTSVKVTELHLDALRRSNEIQYRRLHYRDVFPVQDPSSVEFPVTQEEYVTGSFTQLIDLLPQINEDFQLNLQSVDYINRPLPAFDDTLATIEGTVRLEATPQSLIFIGGVQLKLNLAPEAWQRLHTLVTSTLPASNYW